MTDSRADRGHHDRTAGRHHQDGELRIDRRRPGRRDVDPNLVGMLRGEFDPEAAPPDPEETWSVQEFRRQCGDDLAPARGIFSMALVGLCLWIWAGAIAWLIYTRF